MSRSSLVTILATALSWLPLLALAIFENFISESLGGFFIYMGCFFLIYCGQFLSALTFLYLVMRLIHKGRGYEFRFILLPVNLINLSLAIYFFATR
ncbi:MAG TPA: hypothetical protein PLB62_01465 [Candidatus Sumerlaeota bacterium]|nr:hypothetical protein [Candidatus Sumerlaeota bacterium]